MELTALVGRNLQIFPQNVEYTLDVVVSPSGTVNADYTVFSPGQDKALNSVTLAFVIERDGVVTRSLNGTDVFLPIGFIGQQLRGDSGMEKGFLPALEDGERYCVVFSGTLIDQKTGDESNFFTYKLFEV